jgi:hypothetical protein
MNAHVAADVRMPRSQVGSDRGAGMNAAVAAGVRMRQQFSRTVEALA